MYGSISHSLCLPYKYLNVLTVSVTPDFSDKMWPVLMAAVRNYAPMLVFPFAFVVGVVGYNLEGAVSDKSTPWQKSVLERREERKGREGSGEAEEFKVPETIFDRNKKQ